MSQLITSTQIAPRPNLLGMSRAQLEAFFDKLGEKRFRAAQVMQWIHQRGVCDFALMSNLGRGLREKLARIAEVRPPEVAAQDDSADGTRKWRVRAGGGMVETVLIPAGERATLCVSSQLGCALNCSFCSTGKQGFQRDLSAAEIIGQLWLAIDSYAAFPSARGTGRDSPPGRADASGKGSDKSPAKGLGKGARGLGKHRAVTNVVLMGMGEPLLNFDNVVTAMSLMMDDLAYGISKRRVTLSTSGVVPALDRLAGVSEASLAISLHAPDDALRSELVPINRRYPIAELLASARRYIDAQSDGKRVVTVEYTLIAGVNDRPEQARELARLLRGFPCKINLIPFNPFPDSSYQRPSGNAVSRFRQVLADAGFVVTRRTPRGDDIDAACGQLVGEVVDRRRRRARQGVRASRPGAAPAVALRV